MPISPSSNVYVSILLHFTMQDTGFCFWHQSKRKQVHQKLLPHMWRRQETGTPPKALKGSFCCHDCWRWHVLARQEKHCSSWIFLFSHWLLSCLVLFPYFRQLHVLFLWSLGLWLAFFFSFLPPDLLPKIFSISQYYGSINICPKLQYELASCLLHKKLLFCCQGLISFTVVLLCLPLSLSWKFKFLFVTDHSLLLYQLWNCKIDPEALDQSQNCVRSSPSLYTIGLKTYCSFQGQCSTFQISITVSWITASVWVDRKLLKTSSSSGPPIVKKKKAA